MRTIRLTFYDLRDLLAHYQPFSEEGGFFWPTRQELVEGEHVVLEIDLPNHNEKFSFRCAVLGSLRDRGFEAEPGYLLSIHGEDIEHRDTMMEFVGRNIIGSNRRFHQRYHKAMAVAWTASEGEDLKVGHTENVGLGGAFVRSEVLAPAETVVTLHLRCGETVPSITVNGRVAWTRVEGKDLGMGVQFLNMDPDQSMQLRKVLEEKS